MGFDLDTAFSLLELADILAEPDEKTEQMKRLEDIQTALDQLILREMRAAFEAIGDAMTTSNAETRRIRLHFAEENLLKNTSLDPSLNTGAVTNKYLMARANHGLAYICALRDDVVTAAKHLLRVFLISPCDARRDILPDLYKAKFLPECKEIIDWHARELKSLDADVWRGLRKFARGSAALAIRGAGVVAAIAAGSAAIAKVRIPPQPVYKAADEMAKQVWEHSDDYRLPSRTALEEQFENKLDQRCVECAEMLLKKLGGS